jgi:hypothetical protein
LILITFYRLVTKYHEYLYSPSDFREDSSFLRTITPKERQLKYKKEAQEILENESPTHPDEGSEGYPDGPEADMSPPSSSDNLETVSKQIREIEDKIISIVERELNVSAVRNLKIGSREDRFIVDAGFQTHPLPTFVEIKLVRYPSAIVIDQISSSVLRFESFLKSSYYKLYFVIVLSSDIGKFKNFVIEANKLSQIDPNRIFIRIISLTELENTNKIIYS